MSRPVVLSAVQPPAGHAPTPQELRRQRIGLLEELLRQAAARGSHLALFPEVFNTYGLSGGVPLRAAAEPLEGETVSAARECARRCQTAVVLPIDRLAPDGRLFNTAVFIDRHGAIVGLYDKVHPTRSELAAGKSAGDRFPVFTLDLALGLAARVGAMICHDNSFVESARCLALAGAEIICWPHVQSGWGDIVSDITLRSRAIDNGVWLVASCYSVRGPGAWRPGMMVGRSSVVGQDGFILAEVAREVGVATAAVDLDELRLVHSFTTSGEFPFRQVMLGDRRPDAYGLLAAPREEVWANQPAIVQALGLPPVPAAAAR